MIRNKITCSKCNRDISNSNVKKHFTSCEGVKYKKIRGIDHHPNFGYKDGTRKAWNYNLTKDTDDRVKLNSEKVSKSRINNPNISGWQHSEETKDTLSILACTRLKKNSKYSKNIEYKPGIILESSYEVRVAEILDELSIEWIKVRKGFIWNDNGKIRRYIPDFYLPTFDLYLDPKNDYLIIKDRAKIESAMHLNNIRVIVLNTSNINKDYFLNMLG